MRRDEFANECRRLFSACSRDADLTPERLHVLFSEYGKTDETVWRKAIDIAILDNHLPNAAGMARAVERAELYIQQNRVGEQNREAKGWAARVADAAKRGDTQSAREGFAAIQRMIDHTDEWLPLEPGWERVGQPPPLRDWQEMLNRNRAKRGLPAGPPWYCGHAGADAYWNQVDNPQDDFPDNGSAW